MGEAIAMARVELAFEAEVVAPVTAGESVIGAHFDLRLGDCLDVLRTLSDASVDALVTDPPAGIGFMGKAWDRFSERDAFIGSMKPILKECLRVLKPGGHALVWALPRTSHWTATAVENAGFEVRDVVMHLFGTGFPKSLDVGKAIDKAAGATREVLRIATRAGNAERRGEGEQGQTYGDAHGGFTTISDPVSDGAKKWDGWGTALKPAAEHWILARRPLIGTVASNVLTLGTGALNIDACRIAGEPRPTGTVPSGRWPADVVLSHSPGCQQVGLRVVPRELRGNHAERPADTASSFDMGSGFKIGTATEAIDAYECEPDCAVRLLDEQSGRLKAGVAVRRNVGHSGKHGASFGVAGSRDAEMRDDVTYGDTGGASRFFYVAKASRSERDKGLEALAAKSGGEATDRVDGSAGLNSPRAGAGRTGGAKNTHPTVKSIALMRWLCRLVTPPGGAVLDPFAGSGSTGVAALQEGFNFIGIEREPEYFRIAELRLIDADAALRPAAEA